MLGKILLIAGLLLVLILNLILGLCLAYSYGQYSNASETAQNLSFLIMQKQVQESETF